jgi:hypothetical protein
VRRNNILWLSSRGSVVPVSVRTLLDYMKVDLSTAIIAEHVVPGSCVGPVDESKAAGVKRAGEGGLMAALNQNVEVIVHPCLLAEGGIDTPATVDPQFHTRRGSTE